jgi:hypothetical protein
MNTAKIILRFLIILITSTWGVFFGVLAPLFIMGSEMGISEHYILKVWLITAVIGYFAPCVFAMLNMAKIAAVCSIIGTALTLFIHAEFSEHAQSFMYLPQIFMTILTVIYVVILNPQYIDKKLQKRRERLDAPAPSILEKTPETTERKKK